MDKKEFQSVFKTLVDGLIDEFPITHRIRKFANKFSTAPATVQKWYDGVSAPANASREKIIKHLYADQKKREIIDIVKEIIKNDLKVDANVDQHTPMYPGDSVCIVIKLSLDDEVVSTTYASIDSASCNCGGGY